MLTQQLINENIKKLHSNNKNYINIGLQDGKFINIYIYERVILFLKQKQSIDTVKYSSYYLYNKDNMTLHINDNGSSNCYNEMLKSSNKLYVNHYNLVFYSYYNKKLNNDRFESCYEYDKIDIIESLTYTYNNIDIELLKINNKYSIRIIIKPDSSTQSIYNLINIITNIV